MHYVHTKIGFRSDRKFKYILESEENKKKDSIRRYETWIVKGLGDESEHRTPRDIIRAWEQFDQEWIENRNSRDNKRKLTVRLLTYLSMIKEKISAFKSKPF